ncbi:unnamed protein product [Symbiodinium natans]|uniref:Uncharacterized protein n=1 Tax=Symbiodinium natans TaxID=878477 RepID=A0A812LX27_9DINO|nr:unnamed protein product [Symbiodinium natans]
MGTVQPLSAMALWLEWQAQKKVETRPQKSSEELLCHNFSLEGPIDYMRAGSKEVAACYFGTGANLLLMGPKWNVVKDYIDLSHLKVSVMGPMVCLSGGQDIVLRLFLSSTSDADKWAEILTAASFKRASDKYVAHLDIKMQKQQKAARRAQQAASFGAFVERLCSSRSAAAAEARLKAVLPSHNAPLPIPGEHHVYPARFYLKDLKTEGAGRVCIHGDTLIMQWAERGQVLRRAAVLTGATATTATFMVSVRGANGLAMVRLWMNDAEEAEEMAKAIEESAKASADLLHRKPAPSASTMRRQMGAAAVAVCSCALQAPWTVPRAIYRTLTCSAGSSEKPSTKTGRIENGLFCLDGKCHVLFHKDAVARACHATLREDMLWFGERASVSDQVLSVIGATAAAVDDMVAIYAPNGDVHRLWPDASASAPKDWCQAIQAAGKQSASLSKWEAMIKAEKFEAFAKAEVRRLARSRRFRNLGERLIYLPAKLTGLVHSEQRSAMQVLMDWQETSQRRSEKNRAESSLVGKVQKGRFFRRADARQAPVERTLEIKGDTLFVFDEDGNMEKPIVLAGTENYVNQAIVSVWRDGVLQARMFLATESKAESWGADLETASKLLTNAPRVSRTVSQKAVAPPKLPHEDHHSVQKLHKTRSRRFYSKDVPSGKDDTAVLLPEGAIGA